MQDNCLRLSHQGTKILGIHPFTSHLSLAEAAPGTFTPLTWPVIAKMVPSVPEWWEPGHGQGHPDLAHLAYVNSSSSPLLSQTYPSPMVSYFGNSISVYQVLGQKEGCFIPTFSTPQPHCTYLRKHSGLLTLPPTCSGTQHIFPFMVLPEVQPPAPQLGFLLPAFSDTPGGPPSPSCPSLAAKGCQDRFQCSRHHPHPLVSPNPLLYPAALLPVLLVPCLEP